MHGSISDQTKKDVFFFNFVEKSSYHAHWQPRSCQVYLIIRQDSQEVEIQDICLKLNNIFVLKTKTWHSSPRLKVSALNSSLTWYEANIITFWCLRVFFNENLKIGYPRRSFYFNSPQSNCRAVQGLLVQNTWRDFVSDNHPVMEIQLDNFDFARQH